MWGRGGWGIFFFIAVVPVVLGFVCCLGFFFGGVVVIVLVVVFIMCNRSRDTNQFVTININEEHMPAILTKPVICRSRSFAV